MNKTTTKLAFLIGCALTLTSGAQVTTENFDGLTLPTNFYYQNTATPDWQTSQAIFMYKYAGYWAAGSAYTNVKDTIDGTFTNLYGNITGNGFSGDNYVTVQNRAVITIKNTSIVTGFYITNTTYAWKVIKRGNQFSRKFGDTTGTGSGISIPQGHYPDWFLLTAVGYRNGLQKDSTAKFYLADYRPAGTTNDVAVKSWQFMNCSKIGIVDSIKFFLTSSDVGNFGMNTPAYFCMDNFVTLTTVGVNELESASNISVFPNPAKERVNVNYISKTESNLEISIYDISGKEIFKSFQQNNIGYNRIELQTSTLEAGVYFIQLSDGTGSKKLKFIKL